jgi:hypothetical protein
LGVERAFDSPHTQKRVLDLSVSGVEDNRVLGDNAGIGMAPSPMRWNPASILDFWFEAFKARVPITIMATKFVEDEAFQGDVYWPREINAPMMVGTIRVTVLVICFQSEIEIRKILIESVDDVGAPPHTMYHITMGRLGAGNGSSSWIRQRPSTHFQTRKLLSIVNALRKHAEDLAGEMEVGPIVLHHSIRPTYTYECADRLCVQLMMESVFSNGIAPSRDDIREVVVQAAGVRGGSSDQFDMQNLFEYARDRAGDWDAERMLSHHAACLVFCYEERRKMIRNADSQMLGFLPPELVKVIGGNILSGINQLKDREFCFPPNDLFVRAHKEREIQERQEERERQMQELKEMEMLNPPQSEPRDDETMNSDDYDAMNMASSGGSMARPLHRPFTEPSSVAVLQQPSIPRPSMPRPSMLRPSTTLLHRPFTERAAASTAHNDDLKSSTDYLSDSSGPELCKKYIGAERCNEPVVNEMMTRMSFAPEFCELHQCNHTSRCSRKDHDHVGACH